MKETFQKVFGQPFTVSVMASGRVNLIGEHTDYNGGFVLPTAIPQATHIELALRADNRVRIVSSNMGTDGEEHDFKLGDERQKHHWSDYFEGVTWLLRQKGYTLRGFDAQVYSEVPIGAGLSSSAALLVAMFRALRQAFDLPLTDVQVALLSQAVENEFVGAKVGIMDQMASSLADTHTALFLDTRTILFKKIELPNDEIEIFIINSGVKHNHADGGYNRRRSECEEASRQLGVPQLRDVEDIGQTARLSEPFASRARHIISENARVLKAVEAICKKEWTELGGLMVESHRSMRDDFEVSVPEVDFLVAAALTFPEVYGARLTGGGFGGSIVGICKKGHGRRIADDIAKRYFENMNQVATVLVP